MRRVTRPRRRGLTLMELMLALTVTTIIGGAIAGMLDAVTSGVLTHRDMRESMVRASTTHVRLMSYIEAGRCVLETDGVDLVLWFDDDRESGTVHASEIRWVRFDAPSGELRVEFVAFPQGWSDTAVALEDLEYQLATADWDAIRASYDANGWLVPLTLTDDLKAVAVKTDAAQARDSRQVAYDLTIDTESGEIDVQVSCAITTHQTPER